MKRRLKLVAILPVLASVFLFVGCNNDDDATPPKVEMEEMATEVASKIYNLQSVADPEISGTATFRTYDNDSTVVNLKLNNTPSGGMHPAHIHFNTAAEGGDIALTLATVDGDTGESSTIITTLDDGTAISYQGLLEFDGYINVHLSADDLGTLVGQGDIGQNELTTDSKTYALGSVAVEDIDGTVTFTKRVNGEALAIIQLNNTPVDGMHPGHIHMNTAVEGGDIAFTFAPVNGATGISTTNVAMLDDESAFGYDDVLAYDGYINIHLSADELGTLVAQGDIGQNELTTDSKTYALGSVAVEDIDGTATFTKRANGEALAVIELNNTPEDGMHPGHIHMNTAAEGGDIAFTFNPVNGASGISMTNVAMLDDDTTFGYDDVLAYDGYINLHLSADNLGTLVAQGDIGQNELTGESKNYELAAVSNAAIFGTANFAERVNGETLVTVDLEGTTAGDSHPSHIHMGAVANAPGAIIVSLGSVSGVTGSLKTNITALNGLDGLPNSGDLIDYAGMVAIDGYINVHLSVDELGTLIAQGDVGSNADSGTNDTINYDVTNNGTTSYVFNGNGLSDADNPDLTLERGETYSFTVNASGHPFFIKSVQGNTNANSFNTGVSNNGTETETVTFTVPMDAPDTLYYNCQFHSSMTGTLNITG